MNVCLDLRELYSNIKKNKQEVGKKGDGYNAVILLGGNIGEVRRSFLEVKKNIIGFGKIDSESSLYETEAWGMENANPFLNQVLILKTFLTAEELLENLLELEKNMGRKRGANETYVSRNIDIDILFFDSQIIKSGNLEIPHPRLHLRKFTLAPLMELMPELMHPVFRKNIRELYSELKDNLVVNKIDE